jgi:hypothetical protein
MSCSKKRVHFEKLKSQYGGCGSCSQIGGGCSSCSNALPQSGGGGKILPLLAKTKAQIWIEEVKNVQKELDITYREALSIASHRRKSENDRYITMDDRYVYGLNQKRKNKLESSYKPYGSKNKHPVTFESAQKILLEYYRGKEGATITGLKKKISSCKKSSKTLFPCPDTITSRAQAIRENHLCADSWKYRPGKNAKNTGPGIYDMDGVDNLCGDKHKQAREESRLYNLKSLKKGSKSTKKSN